MRGVMPPLYQYIFMAWCLVSAGTTSSPHIVARMGKMRNAYNILFGKHQWKRPLGRPRRRCVDNIRMDLRETGWEGGDWMHLAQDRDQWRSAVSMVKNIRIPYETGYFLTS